LFHHAISPEWDGVQQEKKMATLTRRKSTVLQQPKFGISKRTLSGS
jgi:hypothetical protein